MIATELFQLNNGEFLELVVGDDVVMEQNWWRE